MCSWPGASRRGYVTLACQARSIRSSCSLRTVQDCMVPHGHTKAPPQVLAPGGGAPPPRTRAPPPPPGGPRIGGLWPTVHCHRSRRQESLFAQVPRRSTGTQVTRRKFCSWLPVASSLLSTMHPNTLTFNLTLVLALHSVGPVSNRWQDHGGGCRGTAQGDAEAH